MRFSIANLTLMAGLMLAALAAAPPARAQGGSPVRLDVPGAVLNVYFTPDDNPVPRERILDWVSRSARAVAVYYGRFPLAEAHILVVTRPGRGVGGGQAFGGRNAHVRINVGRDSSEADLARDWVLVHEMIHLSVPMMDDRHDWLTEGLAVYVESIARLQAGDLDEKTVWKGFVEGMEHGVPRNGDRGLDFTPTWGRKYWGGALFCLFADLEIRKRTNGQKTLQDALRGMLAKADYRTRLPIRDALAMADKATGTTALMDLYEDWRAKAVDPRLPALWKQLGITPEGRSVAFDDGAELASIRKQIGRPLAN